MKAVWKKILSGMVIIFFIFIGLFAWYINDDYDATDEALIALESNEKVTVFEGDPLRFYPKNEEAEIGIIFYPGGKVEEEAYAPLMQSLAEEGYAVFLADMPFGLAVFDINAAESIMAEHPEISQWYVAGHSLGGSMAAIFASNAVEELAGLILLASYSTADLSQTHLSVLSLYGSEDHVLNQEKVEEYRSKLPENHDEIIIAGGNHAQFGNYGIQKGDGESLISAEEQQRITVQEIIQFINEQKTNH